MITPISILSNSPAETAQIAQIISGFCQFGHIIMLDGELGTGKTHFVKSFAEAVGSSDLVTSPTFTIANFYKIDKGNILHIDAYRLSGITEFRELGLSDFFAESIVLIEWGTQILEDFDDYLSISLQYVAGSNDSRQIIITHSGQQWAGKIKAILQQISNKAEWK